LYLFYLIRPSIFFCQLFSELPERNSTKTGHMLQSECNLKMNVRNLGYTLALQIGGQTPLFSTTSQLNGKFNGPYLRNETWYNRASALETTRALLHRLKMS